LDRILRLVMDKAVENLPMDAGALFQFDTESQAYRVAVSHNLSSDHVNQVTFGFHEGVPGWVVRHRQALVIPDATADDRVHPYVVEDGVQSVLAIPLIAREQVVGVLNLYHKTNTNAFDDEAVQLAQVFANQTAIAIENARLVDELRQAATELEARVERRTRQLRETQAQIIRAEKLAVVGRLAASVAHEVNNPLQAIALQLELIADEELAEPASGRLATVQVELARIANIVQRLLDFQRPTPGERAPHQVSALLEDVLKLADKQLQQHNVIVVREEGDDVDPVLVVGDQIKQVFLNLVLNTVEAMPDGG
jgi:signal transduction histidine kinase